MCTVGVGIVYLGVGTVGAVGDPSVLDVVSAVRVGAIGDPLCWSRSVAVGAVVLLVLAQYGSWRGAVSVLVGVVVMD